MTKGEHLTTKEPVGGQEDRKTLAEEATCEFSYLKD